MATNLNFTRCCVRKDLVFGYFGVSSSHEEVRGKINGSEFVIRVSFMGLGIFNL